MFVFGSLFGSLVSFAMLAFVLGLLTVLAACYCFHSDSGIAALLLDVFLMRQSSILLHAIDLIIYHLLGARVELFVRRLLCHCL